MKCKKSINISLAKFETVPDALIMLIPVKVSQVTNYTQAAPR